jgi:PEP-CTERM motif
VRAKKLGLIRSSLYSNNKGIKLKKLIMMLLGGSLLALAPSVHAIPTVQKIDAFACARVKGGTIDRNCVNQKDRIGGNYGSTADSVNFSGPLTFRFGAPINETRAAAIDNFAFHPRRSAIIDPVVVPEPKTSALMLVGLSLIGNSVRRRSGRRIG